jgi:lysophospholipase L1-like esterase
MKVPLGSALLLALASTSDTPLPVHVGGRVVQTANGSASFGWPGIYFESRFEGTALRLRFEAPAEHMRLLIDGEEKALFESAGAVDFTVGNLPPGAHVARFEKMTESQTGGGTFLGFSLPSGGKALPPKAKARQIEFIGDSYTVGYGNRSSKRECTQREVHDLTDTQQAFGPLLAKRLDADYRVNAYSGFGIVRNYNGGSPELSLPAIYPRPKPDIGEAPVSRDTWQPHLIVINLGTNDFSTPLNAGERWKSEAELKTAYRRRYINFVHDLHLTYPKARFILMGSDQFISEVRDVAKALSSGSVRHVRAVRFGELDLLGCDWHPSLADNRKLADLLEREVVAMNPW